MPKAVVLETRFAGHTIGFAKEMAQAFAVSGYDTHLVMNSYARGQPELKESEANPASVHVHWIDPFKPAFASAEQGQAELKLLTELAAKHAPDRLIVPTGDAIAAALPELLEARVYEARLPRMDIVLHHIAAAYLPTGRGTWRRWRRGLAELSNLRRHRLLTCDAYIGLGSGKRGTWPSGARFDYLPHILDKKSSFDAAAARAHFGLPMDKKIIVSIGDVAHRKGIDKLIAAAASPTWPENLKLLLAGPVSSKLRPALDRVLADLPDQIQLTDRFLSNDEFAAAFVAADIIWAVTPGNLGVSSTFLYAARHGKPAIVARSHRSAAWMCARIGQGVRTTLDPPAICAAATRSLQLPPQTPQQATYLNQITDMGSYERIAVA